MVQSVERPFHRMTILVEIGMVFEAQTCIDPYIGEGMNHEATPAARKSPRIRGRARSWLLRAWHSSSYDGRAERARRRRGGRGHRSFSLAQDGFSGTLGRGRQRSLLPEGGFVHRSWSPNHTLRIISCQRKHDSRPRCANGEGMQGEQRAATWATRDER